MHTITALMDSTVGLRLLLHGSLFRYGCMFYVLFGRCSDRKVNVLDLQSKVWLVPRENLILKFKSKKFGFLYTP